MSRGREPKRNGRHVGDLPAPQAAGYTLAKRAYGLTKLDRANATPFRTDAAGWRHYLRVSLRVYRNLRAGRPWNAREERSQP